MSVSKFIKVNNNEGVPYYININHIICVFSHNISQTQIKISGQEDIITDLSMKEVVRRIEDQMSPVR